MGSRDHRKRKNEHKLKYVIRWISPHLKKDDVWQLLSSVIQIDNDKDTADHTGDKATVTWYKFYQGSREPKKIETPSRVYILFKSNTDFERFKSKFHEIKFEPSDQYGVPFYELALYQRLPWDQSSKNRQKNKHMHKSSSKESEPTATLTCDEKGKPLDFLQNTLLEDATFSKFMKMLQSSNEGSEEKQNEDIPLSQTQMDVDEMAKATPLLTQLRARYAQQALAKARSKEKGASVKRNASNTVSGEAQKKKSKSSKKHRKRRKSKLTHGAVSIATNPQAQNLLTSASTSEPFSDAASTSTVGKKKKKHQRGGRRRSVASKSGGSVASKSDGESRPPSRTSIKRGTTSALAHDNPSVPIDSVNDSVPVSVLGSKSNNSLESPQNTPTGASRKSRSRARFKRAKESGGKPTVQKNQGKKAG